MGVPMRRFAKVVYSLRAISFYRGKIERAPLSFLQVLTTALFLSLVLPSCRSNEEKEQLIKSYHGKFPENPYSWLLIRKGDADKLLLGYSQSILGPRAYWDAEEKEWVFEE